jgi:hypothetical protein
MGGVQVVSEKVLEPANRALGIQPIKSCDPAERSTGKYGNEPVTFDPSLHALSFPRSPSQTK